MKSTVQFTENAVLDKSGAAHKSDTEVVRQTGSMELSERLTEGSLNRFTATLTLGAQTVRALQLLADESSGNPAVIGSNSQEFDPETALGKAAANACLPTHTEAAAPATAGSTDQRGVRLGFLKHFPDSLGGLSGSQNAYSKLESRPQRIDVSVVVYDK